MIAKVLQKLKLKRTELLARTFRMPFPHHTTSTDSTSRHLAGVGVTRETSVETTSASEASG